MDKLAEVELIVHTMGGRGGGTEGRDLGRWRGLEFFSGNNSCICRVIQRERMKEEGDVESKFR